MPIFIVNVSSLIIIYPVSKEEKKNLVLVRDLMCFSLDFKPGTSRWIVPKTIVLEERYIGWGWGVY